MYIVALLNRPQPKETQHDGRPAVGDRAVGDQLCETELWETSCGRQSCVEADPIPHDADILFNEFIMLYY
jgi:hypothetical protein